MSVIRSKDNERVKAWTRLAQDAGARREARRALIEGVHLLEACLAAGKQPLEILLREGAAEHAEIGRLLARTGSPPIVMSETLFKRVVGTEAPVGIAAVIEIPADAPVSAASAGCVFLDAVQDAGNVGTILRSAAAFGIGDAILGSGCADPWSPRALRAGMGGQFALRIGITRNLAGEVRQFGETVVCTVVRGGVAIDAVDLTGRVGWLFGGEGAGVSDSAAAAATVRATIPMPGGAESLNVAMSAAVCLYEQRRQLSRRGARS